MQSQVIKSLHPVDTVWIDTNNAFEGELMQIRSRLVAREFNMGPARFVCGDTSVGSSESSDLDPRKSKAIILNHGHRRVPYFLCLCACHWRTEGVSTLENVDC